MGFKKMFGKKQKPVFTKSYYLSRLERLTDTRFKPLFEETQTMQYNVKNAEIKPLSIFDIATIVGSGDALKTSTPFMEEEDNKKYPDYTNVPVNGKGKQPYGNDIFHYNELLCVDVDNTMQEKFLKGELEEQPQHITIEDYKDYLKTYSMDYAIFYPTYSHLKVPDLHKFRFMFQLPVRILDIVTFKRIYLLMQKHVKTHFDTFKFAKEYNERNNIDDRLCKHDIMDKATSSVMNVFYGTNKTVEVKDDILSLDFLKTLLVNESYTIQNNILNIKAVTREENAINNIKTVLKDVKNEKILSEIKDESVKAFFNKDRNTFDKYVSERYDWLMGMGKVYFEDETLCDNEWINICNIIKPDADWQKLYDDTISQSGWTSMSYPLIMRVLNDKPVKTNIKDNYFINRVKKFNNYKELFYNDYLSNNLIVDQVLDNDEKFILLRAETGGGKSTAVMDYILRNQKGYNIFVCPTKSTTKQTYEKMKDKMPVQVLYGNKKFNDKIKTIVTTWDSLDKVKIDKINLLVFDEEHMRVSDMGFRDTAINNTSKFEEIAKKVLFITATPNALNLNEYDLIYNAINNNEITTKVNIEIIKTNKLSYLLSKYRNFEDPNNTSNNLYIDKEVDFFLVNSYNDITNIEDKNTIDFVTVTSKSLDGKNALAKNVYNAIIEDDIIIKNNITCTSIFNVGVSIINDFDVVNLYISGINDPCAIKQTIARFRNAKTINVFILYNGSEKGFIYSYDYLYNRILGYNEAVNEVIKSYYDVNKLTMDFNNEIDYNRMKFETYKKIYNDITTVDLFKEMLEEWFTNVNSVEVKLDNNNKTETLKTKVKNALLEFFKTHTSITAKNYRELNLSEAILDKIKEDKKYKQNIITMIMSGTNKDLETQYIKDCSSKYTNWFKSLCLDKFRKLKPFTAEDLDDIEQAFYKDIPELEEINIEFANELMKRCFKHKKLYYPLTQKNHIILLNKTLNNSNLQDIFNFKSSFAKSRKGYLSTKI